MLTLRWYVRPGDVCLDVGASYGTYTVALAWLVGHHGRVHAFEPRPRSRAVLRTVVRLLAPGNVTIHPVALSDTGGREGLVTPRRRWLVPVPGRSFLRGSLEPHRSGYYEGWDQEFGGACEIEVATDTLDRFVERERPGRVRLVKVDVEGAELRVFHGAAATLSSHQPVLVCEVEDRHTRKYGHDSDEVISFLAGLGYRPHIYDGARLTPVDHIRGDTNNYLFLPEG